jgi:hypothetical protein
MHAQQRNQAKRALQNEQGRQARRHGGKGKDGMSATNEHAPAAGGKLNTDTGLMMLPARGDDSAA